MEYPKIAIIIGTKAELIKCIPIMLELKKQKKDYWFIHTGQHPVKKACEEFGVKYPDFILSDEPKLSTKFWSKINGNSLLWSFKMLFLIRRRIKKIKPKYIIYHGDTMSSALAAIASSKFLNFNKNWKNVHLEAGLRSGSLAEPFPEEISRRICDRFSDILLAVSDFSKQNLLKEGFPEYKIKQVGNTVVDSSIISQKIAKKMFKKLKYKYALINIHRHENLKNKKRLAKIVRIINNVGIKSIWPLHDNTRRYLEKHGLFKEIEKNKKIIITPLENYFKFIFLMNNCEYLITDGGSIQEESLVFKKPCIILRMRTERQEGLSTEINFLTKLDIKKNIELIKKLEGKQTKIKNFKNPYGKPGVSKRILEILK